MNEYFCEIVISNIYKEHVWFFTVGPSLKQKNSLLAATTALG